jgi:hypothetical protein
MPVRTAAKKVADSTPENTVRRCYDGVPCFVDCTEVSGWVACASVGGGWEPWLARAHARRKTGTGTLGAQGCLLTQSQAKPVSLTQPDSYSLLQFDGNKL